MITALLLTLLVLAPGAESGATTINQILVQLKAPKPDSTPQSFQLKEADVNEFITVALTDKPRLGVKKIRLDFQEAGKLLAEAVVNMDDVKIEVTGIDLFKKLLSGTQVFKAEGRLMVNERKARFEIDKASINDIWVPAWLAQAVVGMVGKSQPPHIDITEEFDLPFDIKEVVIHSDRVDITR